MGRNVGREGRGRSSDKAGSLVSAGKQGSDQPGWGTPVNFASRSNEPQQLFHRP